jgi:hypothetical protein
MNPRVNVHVMNEEYIQNDTRHHAFKHETQARVW